MRYLVVEIAPGNDEPTFYGSDDGDAVRQLTSVLEQGSRVFVVDMATGHHLTSVESTLAALAKV
jgi:hypothetical protein